MGRRKGPGLAFSWKRALGSSAAMGRLSRQLGVPLTRQGRQRKGGKAMGYCAPFIAMVLAAGAVGVGVASIGEAMARITRDGPRISPRTSRQRRGREWRYADFGEILPGE